MIADTWQVLFFSFQRMSYIFPVSFLDIFWNSIYLACIVDWLRGFGLRLYFYLSERASLVSDFDFFYYTFTHFAPVGVIKDRVTKISSKNFNGKLRSFHLFQLISCILYALVHKVWLLKSLFLSQMYLHIVILKPLVSC